MHKMNFYKKCESTFNETLINFGGKVALLADTLNENIVNEITASDKLELDIYVDSNKNYSKISESIKINSIDCFDPWDYNSVLIYGNSDILTEKAIKCSKYATPVFSISNV